MVESVQATLRTALFSASLPALLAIAWWLSLRQRLPTPDEPCNLQNWGCSTGISLLGSLLLYGIPVVFPLVTLYGQHRLIWRSQTVLTIPQMIASLSPAPLIISILAFVLGVKGEGELAALAVLAYIPTMVVAALQQVLIRHQLLRRQVERPASSPPATASASLLLGCYTLLLPVGAILTWGPSGKSFQQLLPGATLVLLFLAFCAGSYAAFALYFLVRSSTSPSPLGRAFRVLSALAGVTGVVVVSGWGLLTALIQDEVVEEVAAAGSTYLGTRGDYPPTCYHLYNGGLLMGRACVSAEQLGLGVPDAALSNDLTPEASLGPQSLQSTPPPSEIQTSPDVYPAESVVASSGNLGIVQTASSLGQKGTYAFAQRSNGPWVLGATIVEDAAFTDFVRVEHLLLAAFAPSPNFSLMVSIDDGHTWQPADLQSAAIPEEMRYFHDLGYDDGVFLLATGYASWVVSGDVNKWISSDGLTWKPLVTSH